MTDGKTANESGAPQEQHQQLRAELDSVRLQVQRLPQSDLARRDLMAMSNTIESIWHKLDNEMIACRRRQRATANYLEMVGQIKERLAIMKREVFWRKLH